MAKCITVYLVRHGETAWNARKITQGQRQSRLNANGKIQAVKMARIFREIPLTAIYCSPLLRTRQTAREVLKYHSHLKLVFLPELKERDAGKFEGLCHKKRMQLMPDMYERWKKEGADWRPPGGESIRELHKRANSCFSKIIKKHRQGDNILIVSHGGPLKCIIHKLHCGKLNDIFHREALGNCEVLQVLWDKGPKRIQCILK